jgi:hypothetical protein
MRGMIQVSARRCHVDSVGIGVVPHGFLERGDRLAVADPCVPTDQTFLEELPDTMRSGLIQPLADQLA